MRVRLLKTVLIALLTSFAILTSGAVAAIEDSPGASLQIQTDVSMLEQKFFNKTFSSESTEYRMARLEEFIFGAKSSGSLQARATKLHKVMNSSATVDGAKPPPAQMTIAVSKPPPVQPKPKSLIAVLNSGIDNYNRHRYHNAEDNFELACAAAPGMSRAHAYLAITKLQINERQSAIDEFRACYEIDPFSNYGRYAKYCLLTLSGDEAVRQKGPIDSPKILDATLRKINAQTAEHVAQHRNSVASMPFRRPRSSMFAGNYAQDSYWSQRKSQADAAARAASIQESANNLKHLLASKIMPGDAKLRAWGTTLHTRYYGNETNLLAPDYIPREYPKTLRAIALSYKKRSHRSKKK